MKLYITYCHDRHIDPDVQVFTDKQKAIDYAWEYMTNSVAHPDGLADLPVRGRVLNIRYGEVEDHAFVVERGIDDQTA